MRNNNIIFKTFRRRKKGNQFWYISSHSIWLKKYIDRVVKLTNDYPTSGRYSSFLTNCHFNDAGAGIIPFLVFGQDSSENRFIYSLSDQKLSFTLKMTGSCITANIRKYLPLLKHMSMWCELIVSTDLCHICPFLEANKYQYLFEI